MTFGEVTVVGSHLVQVLQPSEVLSKSIPDLPGRTYYALQFRSLLVMELLGCVGNHVVVTPTFLKLPLVAVLRRNARSKKQHKTRIPRRRTVRSKGERSQQFKMDGEKK